MIETFSVEDHDDLVIDCSYSAVSSIIQGIFHDDVSIFVIAYKDVPVTCAWQDGELSNHICVYPRFSAVSCCKNNVCSYSWLLQRIHCRHSLFFFVPYISSNKYCVVQLHTFNCQIWPFFDETLIDRRILCLFWGDETRRVVPIDEFQLSPPANLLVNSPPARVRLGYRGVWIRSSTFLPQVKDLLLLN